MISFCQWELIIAVKLQTVDEPQYFNQLSGSSWVIYDSNIFDALLAASEREFKCIPAHGDWKLNSVFFRISESKVFYILFQLRKCKVELWTNWLRLTQLEEIIK